MGAPLVRVGLLGYLVRDVIGAHQEESFGIRQNHTMGLKEWHELDRTNISMTPSTRCSCRSADGVNGS